MALLFEPVPQVKTPAFLAGVAKALAARLSFLRGTDAAAPRAKPGPREWSAQLLRQLEWRRFEELCVAYYEALGYTPQITGTGTLGGVDIVLHEKDSERTSALARCKAWDAYRVGTKAVKELRAAMTAAGIDEGILLTSGRFTHEAVALARTCNIRLVDGAALLAEIGALPLEKQLALLEFATEGDYLTPTCPLCSIKMVPRQSTKEGRKFWGCPNYPACKQTAPVQPGAA